MAGWTPSANPTHQLIKNQPIADHTPNITFNCMAKISPMVVQFLKAGWL
jgi:hypothetical protein